MTQNPNHVLFNHDYLIEIKERLSKKANILKISTIHTETGVSRFVISKFMAGEIPSTSFQNIVTLYRYLEENNI